MLSDYIPALEPCTASETVRKNLNVMHCARKAFIAAEASERIRRALRMKVRVSNDLVVTNGESVYYRRNNYKGWKGPGTVMGRDNKLVLVRHGGEFYRVPLCHILPTSQARSEVESNSEVQSDNSNHDNSSHDGQSESEDSDDYNSDHSDNFDHEDDV